MRQTPPRPSLRTICFAIGHDQNLSWPVVSIHAPAGGETTTVEYASGAKYVSIHAPAGGATA